MISKIRNRTAWGTNSSLLVLFLILLIDVTAAAVYFRNRPAPPKLAVVGFEQSESKSREGQVANVRITIEPPYPGLLRVGVAPAGNISSTGYDFESPLMEAKDNGWNLTIPALAPVVNLPLRFIDDGQKKTEPGRLVLQLVGEEQGRAIGELSLHTLTVLDPYVPPIVQFADSEPHVAKEGEKLLLEVVAEGDIEKELKVPFTVVAGSATDVETKPSGGSIEFKLGQHRGSIELTALHDHLYEGDESITIGLQEDGDAYVLGTRKHSKVQLTDLDPEPSYSIAPAEPTVAASEPLQCILTASVASAVDRMIPFDIEPVGEAKPRITDALPRPPDFKLAAGSAEAVAAVDVSQVPWELGNHQLRLVLDEKFGGGTATVTVSNLDFSVQLLVENGTLQENSGEIARLKIRLSNDVAAPANIPVVLEGSGTAESDRDFHINGAEVTVDESSGTWRAVVQIPAGEKSVTLEVIPIDDNLDEEDKKAVVSLASTVAKRDDAYKMATVRFIDDDPQPRLKLSTDDTDLVEGKDQDAEIRISVVGSAETEKRISGRITIIGNAKAGTDYEITTSEFILEPGEREAKFVIHVLDNDKADRKNPRKLITLGLSEMTNADPSDDAGLRLTITDDDVFAGKTLLLVAKTDHLSEYREALWDELKKVLKKEPDDDRVQLIGGTPFIFDRQDERAWTDLLKDGDQENNVFQEEECSAVLNRALRVEKRIRRLRGDEESPFDVILLYPHSLRSLRDDSAIPLELPVGPQNPRKVIIVGTTETRLNSNRDAIVSIHKYSGGDRQELTIDDPRDDHLNSMLISLLRELK